MGFQTVWGGAASENTIHGWTWGGINTLKATFDFVNGTVKTSIVWADDGIDSSSNQDYQDGLGVSATDCTVTKISDFPRIQPSRFDKISEGGARIMILRLCVSLLQRCGKSWSRTRPSISRLTSVWGTG